MIGRYKKAVSSRANNRWMDLTDGGFWPAARPPHPHAAALFVDFTLGRKAQEIVANQGRWVSRKDVKYQVDPGQRKQQVVSHEKWGERTTELVQLYNRLIMRAAK
jgi:ABC-type Fe3+ transport system substrate-binding protein